MRPASNPSKPASKKLQKSSFAAVSNAIGKLFDRSDEGMVKIHDGLVNAGFFVVACYGIYRYGHKIAV